MAESGRMPQFINTMKKLMLFVCALFIAATTNAQKVLTDDVNRTENEKTSTAHGTDPEVNDLQGGFGLDYLGIEDGWGIGLNIPMMKYAVIDAGYSSAGSDGVDVSSWYVGIGGHYRYWFNKWLFIEGNIGVLYGHTSIDIDYDSGSYSTRAKPNNFKDNVGTGSSSTGSDSYDDSDGAFGLFFTPRLGIRLFKFGNSDIALVGGYRWNFSDFKFDKEHTSDYFTIGIASIF